MKMATGFYNFVRKHYISIVIMSTIVTFIGFSLAITAESHNKYIKSLENDENLDFSKIDKIFKLKNEMDTLAISGILMLFIGFLITSSVQTYMLFHTRKHSGLNNSNSGLHP
jgi:uncharacterized membrane protein